MHELGIAQNILEIVQQSVPEEQAPDVKWIRIRIGQLSGIVPDALSFSFEVITSGTELEGARLVMETIPLRGWCRKCEKEFEIKEYAFECPFCSSPDIDTISGQDLSIVDMEVD